MSPSSSVTDSKGSCARVKSPSSSVTDSKGSCARVKNEVAFKKASKSGGSSGIQKKRKTTSYSAGETTREEVAEAVLARDCEAEQKNRVSGSENVKSTSTGSTGRKSSERSSSSDSGSSCSEDEIIASGVAAIRSPRSQGFGATFAQDAAVEKRGNHHSSGDDDDKDKKLQSKKRSTLATTTSASAKNRKKPRVGAPKDDRQGNESDGEVDVSVSLSQNSSQLLLPTSQLTTAAGQIEQNPGMDYSQAVTNAKREYNRRNAARARKRAKVQVTKLRQQAHSLSGDVDKLKESNAKLQAELDALRDQSIVLVQNLQVIRAAASVPYPNAAIAHSGQPSPNLVQELLLAMNSNQDRFAQGGNTVANQALAYAQQQQQQQVTVDQQLRDLILASFSNSGSAHLQNALLPTLPNLPWSLTANAATDVDGTLNSSNSNNAQVTTNNNNTTTTTNDNSSATTSMLLQMLQNALGGPPPPQS